MDQQHQLPPGLLFRSFLIVAGAYVVSVGAILISAGLLLSIYVPEQISPDDFSADPAKYLGGAVFLWLFGINLAISFGLGWCVARLAPFGRFPHCVFLAVLTFIGYLQQVLGVPESAKWIYLIFMIAFPIAILFGGSKSLARLDRLTQAKEEELL